jgi:nicotinamidase-related amidase
MGDLHGNAPDFSPTVVLLIDVINDLEFPGGDEIARHAVPMAQALSRLTARARSAGVAVIYCNDNFGRWRSDFRAQLHHCLDEPVRGRAIAQLLRPVETDYFVLKPKHSAFYSTALGILLHHLEARTLIIGGIATESCVLFTANDAYLRDYRVIVPSDGVVSARPVDSQKALDQMRLVLKADVRPVDDIELPSPSGPTVRSPSWS